eukprot:scaffold15432_cov101-Isochrysis_galbana.AAC.2
MRDTGQGTPLLSAAPTRPHPRAHCPRDTLDTGQGGGRDAPLALQAPRHGPPLCATSGFGYLVFRLPCVSTTLCFGYLVFRLPCVSATLCFGYLVFRPAYVSATFVFPRDRRLAVLSVRVAVACLFRICGRPGPMPLEAQP